MSDVAAVLRGDVRSAARLMRDLDDRVPPAVEALKALYPHTGRGYILGLTGSPGSGKSSLADALIAHYRERGLRVGVVAIDPSSPFTGGAILGDRIRMQRHATDDGVFIRSLATRGHLGGLSRSTGDIVAVLDAMGYDRILVETVGVGQDEIEVVAHAHTCLVVTVPGLGDEVQALKAGILEVADILVVNKADREGADRTAHDLESMLHLRPSGDGARPVPVLKTIATQDAGIADLCDAAESRRDQAMGAGGSDRALRRARAQVLEILRDDLTDRALASGGLDAVFADVASRRLDPYTAAARIVKELARPR